MIRRTLASSPVAISKGMQALKLCSSKILQFLTRVLAKMVDLFDLCIGHKMVVVVHIL